MTRGIYLIGGNSRIITDQHKALLQRSNENDELTECPTKVLLQWSN